MIESGFLQGDKIVSIDGEPVTDRAEFIEKILIDGLRNVVVARDTQKIELRLPADLAQRILAAEELNLMDIRYPFVIDDIQPGSPAEHAGMQPGDSIVGVNGKNTAVFQEISAEMESFAGREVAFLFFRNGIQQKLLVKLDENAKLGVSLRPLYNYFNTEKIEYGLLEAIPAGISLGWETLVSYVKQFKLVFTKEGSKQIGGFGSIGKMFPRAWDWQIFWNMTALLSIVLAFMNFLPIPGLDGGHVMFIVYEIITGKKPGDKFLEYAQTAGMVLLFALLIYANGNDIFKAFFK
jgi:regulator of sigma E protease